MWGGVSLWGGVLVGGRRGGRGEVGGVKMEESGGGWWRRRWGWRGERGGRVVQEEMGLKAGEVGAGRGRSAERGWGLADTVLRGPLGLIELKLFDLGA